MIKKEQLPECPVATTLWLIGNKWKMSILQRLLDRPYYFGELRKSISGISQKVLTDNLRAMENDGIIIRTVFNGVPPKVEYKLSDVGNSMKAIIAEMHKWGLQYQKTINSWED